MKRLCVFCGSSCGADPVHAAAARDVGAAIAAAGLGLVYGGGRVGLMGILADAALDAGGQVVGVIPDALATDEVAHGGLTELRVVASMHERKALMAHLSDGFLALPGGYGTFDELFEILTWAQLGIHAKPVGILNVSGYFDALLAMLDRAVAERFLREEHRGRLLVAESADRAVRMLLAASADEPPAIGKWINP